MIALGSDIDCIPQASQKPGVAYHDPMIEGAPGHGEGHNSGQAVNIVAALAVKRLMEREHLSRAPSRSGRASPKNCSDRKRTTCAPAISRTWTSRCSRTSSSKFDCAAGARSLGSGLVSVEYLFKGESAHSAGAPWRGRSALDAVELMDVGWNFRREHLRLQQRSHYVITDGGDQPNVVPPTAAVWYYFRELDYPHIKGLWEIGDKMAQGAAMMTDTSFTSRVLGAAWPVHMNKPIAEAMYANIKQVGLPQWSEDDQTLAKALQKELKVKEEGLATKIDEQKPPPKEEERMGGGSDDIGDISWNVPTVTLWYPVQHSESAGTQLVGRDRDGDARSRTKAR